MMTKTNLKLLNDMKDEINEMAGILEEDYLDGNIVHDLPICNRITAQCMKYSVAIKKNLKENNIPVDGLEDIEAATQTALAIEDPDLKGFAITRIVLVSTYRIAKSYLKLQKILQSDICNV